MENEGRGRSVGVYLAVVLTTYAVQLTTFPKHPFNKVPVRFVEDKLLENELLNRKHAVVIDAGSTGSRVLAFSFYTSLVSGDLVLFDELWHEEKPGLSSYADQPHLAAQSVSKLISMAKDRIPEQFWESTPITLKATAGLRLLPEDQADEIINTVKSTLKTSGFTQLTSDPGVEIMSDLDEGICGWMTVNFLLDFLANSDESAAALDLGGGSTQVSFLPTWASTINESPESFIVEKQISEGNDKIYTHSYLGLGLMAARKSVIKDSEKKEGEGDTVYISPCFTKDVTWSQKDGEYKISPADNPDFHKCHAHISNFVLSKSVHSPEELRSRTVVGFSYFYDRGVDSGMIPAAGGVVSVLQYKQAAERECSKSETDFLCFDLTFIYSLLRSYGLSDSNEVHVYKKINGYETSWALGLALQLLAE